MRRRLLWATLPYYGWVGVTGEEIADGARPCPWYAHPLSWLFRFVEWTGATLFDPLPEYPSTECGCEECREALAANPRPERSSDAD